MDALFEFWKIVLVATVASFVVSILIIATKSWHGKLTLDLELDGAQKFHKIPVPRVGGIALMAGIVSVAAVDYLAPGGSLSGTGSGDLPMLALAAVPAFLAGLTEDLTKSISVTIRLSASLLSAVAAWWLIGAYLPRLDFWGVDVLLTYTPVAIAVSAFAVAGVANSINIIDGFNGLAGFSGIVILAALSVLCWQSGDMQVVKIALAGIGATIGFLILNYPTGRIFMGDGGAYLLGFWVAEVAVLTVLRNPEISPWQVLAVCAYPIIEVVYSVYRKTVVRKGSASVPDRLHFHMLIYRRLICRAVPVDRREWLRNAMVAYVILAGTGPMVVLSVLFGRSVQGAVLILLAQVFLYMAVYARLVRGHWCLNPVIAFGLSPEHKVRSR